MAIALCGVSGGVRPTAGLCRQGAGQGGADLAVLTPHENMALVGDDVLGIWARLTSASGLMRPSQASTRGSSNALLSALCTQDRESR